LFLKSTLGIESAADFDKVQGQGWKIGLMILWRDAQVGINVIPKVVLFTVGLSIAVGFNVDTIAIHRVLSKDRPARETTCSNGH
jgi:hypothetical protein